MAEIKKLKRFDFKKLSKRENFILKGILLNSINFSDDGSANLEIAGEYQQSFFINGTVDGIDRKSYKYTIESLKNKGYIIQQEETYMGGGDYEKCVWYNISSKCFDFKIWFDSLPKEIKDYHYYYKFRDWLFYNCPHNSKEKWESEFKEREYISKRVVEKYCLYRVGDTVNFVRHEATSNWSMKDFQKGIITRIRFDFVSPFRIDDFWIINLQPINCNDELKEDIEFGFKYNSLFWI